MEKANSLGFQKVTDQFQLSATSTDLLLLPFELYLTAFLLQEMCFYLSCSIAELLPVSFFPVLTVSRTSLYRRNNPSLESHNYIQMSRSESNFVSLQNKQSPKYKKQHIWESATLFSFDTSFQFTKHWTPELSHTST